MPAPQSRLVAWSLFATVWCLSTTFAIGQESADGKVFTQKPEIAPAAGAIAEPTPDKPQTKVFADGPTPSWIWGADQNKKYFVRTKFAGKAQFALLKATCDNVMTVWVNGQKVASSSSWANPVEVDIKSKLKAGENLVEAEITNAGGIAGFCAKIVLQERDGKNGIVVTDALIMEGVLGGGEGEAVVRALYAGCDSLLYPSDVVASEQAVRKAIDDKRLDGDSIHRSLERRRRWARWAALSRETNRPTRDESGWSIQLAEQVVHPLNGKIPRLPQPWNLVIVDDDVGGPYPAPSRDPLISSLRAGGIDLRVKGEGSDIPDGGSTVIAVFGDIRAWKGRPGYSASAKESVRNALEEAGSRERLIVEFSHPRLADELAVDAPVLCAWGGEAVMQKAAARVLLRDVAVARGGRSAGAAG